MEKDKAPSSSGKEEVKDSPDTAKKGTKKDPKKESSKTETTKKKTASKAEAVLTAEEIGRMIDFGLGRGVNAALSTPWLQKSSFQVQQVTPLNIVGTEEGGIVQSYVNEVESVQDIQTQLSESIPVSAQISIGIDAELSRSYSSTRKSLGKKIITRSISFKPDISNTDEAYVLPKPAVTALGKGPETKAKDEATPALLPFEQQLSIWIIGRFLDEEIKGLEMASFHLNPIDVLAKFIIDWPGGLMEVKEMLKNKCSDFVSHFNITHYVSGIELGASLYQVLTEEQFKEKAGVKSSLEILSIVGPTIDTKISRRRKTATSQTTEIGRFEGSEVSRGTTDEAVVGVKLKPISSLITLRVLQSALQCAIKNYITDQEHSKDGPFIISCHNETIFLKVTPDFQVVATSKVEDSSDFYITYSEDGHSAFEFSITYLAPSSLTRREIKPISRYLYAPVDARGRNSGPLTLQLNAESKHTRMTLYSRRVKNSGPVDTKDWLTSRNIFFINCKQRFFRSDSYICVKSAPQNSAEEYTTCCVPTTKMHDETKQHYMLFRLIRASKREPQEEAKRKAELEDSPLGIRRKSLAEKIEQHSSYIRRDSPLSVVNAGVQLATMRRIGEEKEQDGENSFVDETNV